MLARDSVRLGAQCGRSKQICHALFKRNARPPPENLFRLAIVRERIVSIAWSRRSVHDRPANHARDLIDAYVAACAYIDRASIGDLRIHCEQVGARNVSYVSEVARLLAVAIDRKRLAGATLA